MAWQNTSSFPLCPGHPPGPTLLQNSFLGNFNSENSSVSCGMPRTCLSSDLPRGNGSAGLLREYAQGNRKRPESFSLKLMVVCGVACRQQRCQAAPIGLPEGKEFLQRAPPACLGPVHWRPVRKVPSTALDLSDRPDFLWRLQVVNFLDDVFRLHSPLEATEGALR